MTEPAAELTPTPETPGRNLAGDGPIRVPAGAAHARAPWLLASARRTRVTPWIVPLCAALGGACALPLQHATERSVAALRRAGDGSTDEQGRAQLPRALDGAFGLATTVALVEAAAAARLGPHWRLGPAFVFFAGLAALALCDARYLLLPRRIQYPLVALTAAAEVVAALASHEPHRLVTAALCGAIAFGAFFVMNLISPRAMAFGDVRLAGAIGLFAGWYSPRRAVVAFVVATVLAALVSLALLATRRASLRTALPFGVFLAAGTVIALLA